jgi:hypothetical protein
VPRADRRELISAPLSTSVVATGCSASHRGGSASAAIRTWTKPDVLPIAAVVPLASIASALGSSLPPIRALALSTLAQ